MAPHVEVGLQVEFMSCTVCTVARCLVGWNAPRKTPFQRQRTNRNEPISHSQAIRDNENKTRRRVKLGQNESERLGFANMRNKRVVPCNPLQDQKWNKSFGFFSQNLKMWCTEAIEKAGVQRQELPGRLFHQNAPDLARLALKQMRDLGLTAIQSDKDSGFVL